MTFLTTEKPQDHDSYCKPMIRLPRSNRRLTKVWTLSLIY